MDQQERYQELLGQVDQLKQKHISAVAKKEAIEQRIDELKAEASAMGIQSLDSLPQKIQELEQTIEAGLSEVESILAGLDAPEGETTEQPVEEMPIQSGASDVSLDDLLNSVD